MADTLFLYTCVHASFLNLISRNHLRPSFENASIGEKRKSKQHRAESPLICMKNRSSHKLVFKKARKKEAFFCSLSIWKLWSREKAARRKKKKKKILAKSIEPRRNGILFRSWREKKKPDTFPTDFGAESHDGSKRLLITGTWIVLHAFPCIAALSWKKHKVSWSPDLEALRLWKSLSGSCQLSLQKQNVTRSFFPALCVLTNGIQQIQFEHPTDHFTNFRASKPVHRRSWTKYNSLMGWMESSKKWPGSLSNGEETYLANPYN